MNFFLILALSNFLQPVALAKGETELASSGKSKVQLLELYSSESCSSCPPADQWVSELKSHGELWKTFVPVVFHVDYWNNLGWVDEFSSEPMTQRQYALSKQWKNPSIYTPAMVVDGQEWRAWRKSSTHQLPKPGDSEQISLSIFKNDDGYFRIVIDGIKNSEKYIVRWAELGMDLQTKVTSGENSGKTLAHNFVILHWENQKFDSSKKDLQFKFNKTKKTERK